MILITGLDGSGKSTLLSKLENALGPDDAVLRVPTIDCELFASNQALYQTARFINEIGKMADETKNPQLKIVAMFGAMVLVPSLSKELRKSDRTRLFFERHPLIDTRVYGAAYFKLMHPELIDRTTFDPIEEKFSEEFDFLLDLTPIKTTRSQFGPSHDLMQFLQQLFSQDSEQINEDLQLLFPIEKPNHAYFLDAKAETLHDRLDSRSTREHHESVELLSKMRPIYTKVFSELKIAHTIIDASNWEELDLFTEKIIGEFGASTL